jgi:hypothetical protein
MNSGGRGRHPRPRRNRGQIVNDNELLPNWNEGATTAAILEFVESVTTPGASYVPPADRMATFDNDGTLWCEKPQYVQVGLLLGRWKAMIEADPAKAEEQPYEALAENDLSWFSNLYSHLADLLKGIGEAYQGYTVEAFEQAVLKFFATATHPTLGVPYTKTGYQPMRELLDLLHAHDFLVFICSGGGRDFMRPEKALAEAKEHGWTIVSMHDDFKTVFAP